MAPEGINLRELERCFFGSVPATIATCAPDGTPNVTYLSIVHMVDDGHLALSNQFFNKTQQNIRQNPRVQVLLPHPVTGEQYRIDARYERSEAGGPIFERMRQNLDAVAAQTGMQAVFRLVGADIYRVLGVEKLACDLDLSTAEGPTDFLAGLETLSGRLAACDDLDGLFNTTLEGLAELFDYPHAMILLADELGTRLFTVASRGFPQSGVGAEVAFGEGLIGAAALQRRPIRVANLSFEQMLARAVVDTARDHGQQLGGLREIPLPGLADTRSQVAVPILARGPILGVLCVQSPEPARLSHSDEHALTTLARHLATSMQLLGQAADGGTRVNPLPSGGKTVRIKHYASDDSIFIDDDYLIKGLSGRILVHLLDAHQKQGRLDFTNKELRVDESLRHSAYRDNLESRLILLTRRLEERSEALRLVKTGRGRFRLDIKGTLELTIGL